MTLITTLLISGVILGLLGFFDRHRHGHPDQVGSGWVSRP